MIHYKKPSAPKAQYSIGLDLDGTSGAFHEAFRDVLISKQGFAETDIPVEAPKIYSYVEAGVFNCPKKFSRALHAATGQGVYRNLVPYSGFQKAILDLVENGAEIKIITSRPDDALEDTIFWLENVARIPYHEINICHEKTKVMADVYIDDMPAHVEAIRAAGREAIVFDQAYNQEVDGLRMKDWSEASDLMKNIRRPVFA